MECCYHPGQNWCARLMDDVNVDVKQLAPVLPVAVAMVDV